MIFLWHTVQYIYMYIYLYIFIYIQCSVFYLEVFQWVKCVLLMISVEYYRLFAVHLNISLCSVLIRMNRHTVVLLPVLSATSYGPILPVWLEMTHLLTPSCFMWRSQSCCSFLQNHSLLFRYCWWCWKQHKVSNTSQDSQSQHEPGLFSWAAADLRMFWAESHIRPVMAWDQSSACMYTVTA